MKHFTTYPFLRLLVPFVAGILVALNVSLNIPVAMTVVLFVICLIVALYTGTSGNLKFMFFAAMDVFLFTMAVSLVRLGNPYNAAGYFGHHLPGDSACTFVATISDVPEKKDKTYRLSMEMVAIRKGDQFMPVKGSLISYARKSRLTASLRAGDAVVFHATVGTVSPPMNPGEFDYRQYLADRGIFYSCFIDSAAIRKIPLTAGLNPVWRLGLYCKQALLDRIYGAGLSANAAAICAALITGYDADIGDDVVNAFAHTGTLHVLSVSGLHTGILYLVLGFLFDAFDRRKQRPVLRFAIITVALWLFALTAGFAAPVLRAVIMFNLLGAGRLFIGQTRVNHLNLLFVSAFILLLWNPRFIRDAGFLLSYLAMAGLIVVQPWLTKQYRPTNRVANYTWQSITASAAATLTTLPLTLFFFKQFPVWFFICNLVVVPAGFVLLVLGFSLVVNAYMVPVIINTLTDFLIWFLELFNSERFGYISQINFTGFDAMVLSLLILVGGWAIADRRPLPALATMVLVVLWQISSLATSAINMSKTELIVFHSSKQSLVAVKNGADTRMVSTNSKDAAFHALPYLTSLNAKPVMEPFNYIESNGEATLLLGNVAGATTQRWSDVAGEKVTTLLLSNNFILTFTDAARWPALEMVVCDGTNKAAAVRKIAAVCSKMNIRFYDTRSQGALIKEL